jgi:outer membrane lipoprotein
MKPALTRVLLFILIVFVISCGPVISKQVMSYVDPSISFQDLIKDPERFKGKTVVVGGRVISTSVKPGETWMEILQQPLGSRQKPEDTDASLGRVLVKFADYRDPAVYSPGRSITVAGQVLGKQIRRLGQIDYSYPALLAREAHLWEIESYPSEPRFTFGVGVGVFHYH